MGIIKDFFFGKEKVEPIIDNSTNPDFCNEKCELCGQVIALKRYKKLQGNYFHKNCFKHKQKEIMNGDVMKSG